MTLKKISDRLGEISFIKLLWMSPVITVIHNLEETLLIKDALRAGRETLIVKNNGFLSQAFPPAYGQFCIASAMIDIAALALFLWALSKPTRFRVQANLVMVMILFQSAVTQIVTTAQKNSFQPGLLVGTFIAIPCAVYFFRRALRENIIGTVSFSYLFLIALFVHPVANIIALVAGWYIAGALGLS